MTIFPNLRKVGSRERIAFRCTRCGACCKNVRDSILLNPLDAYRLVNLLRDEGAVGPPIDILEGVAELKELTRGFHIYMLRTLNDSGVCTFLKENRCSVYTARPATCRLYPFSSDVKADGTVDWSLCLEQPQHFKGGSMTAREWRRKPLNDETIRFFQKETEWMPLIGKLLNDVPNSRLREAEIQTLAFYYFAYDYSQPFLFQYENNMAFLAAKLRGLQNE